MLTATFGDADAKVPTALITSNLESAEEVEQAADCSGNSKTNSIPPEVPENLCSMAVTDNGSMQTETEIDHQKKIRDIIVKQVLIIKYHFNLCPL